MVKNYTRPSWLYPSFNVTEQDCADYDTVQKALLRHKKSIILVNDDPMRFFGNRNVRGIYYDGIQDPSIQEPLDNAYQYYLDSLPFTEYSAIMRSSCNKQQLFKRENDEWDHFYPLKKAWERGVDFRYVLSVFNTYYIHRSTNRQKSTRLLLTTQEFYDFIYECHQSNNLGVEYAKQAVIVREICEGIFPPKKPKKRKRKPTRY